MNKIRDFLNEYGASAAIIGLLVFVFNKHEKSIDHEQKENKRTPTLFDSTPPPSRRRRLSAAALPCADGASV